MIACQYPSKGNFAMVLKFEEEEVEETPRRSSPIPRLRSTREMKFEEEVAQVKVELAFANKQVKTWMAAGEKWWEYLSKIEGISVILTNSSTPRPNSLLFCFQLHEALQQTQKKRANRVSDIQMFLKILLFK